MRSTRQRKLPNALDHTGDAGTRNSTWHSVFALASLYVSFGIIFGVLEFTVPPVLLERGVDLAKMGWLAALYLPFGLTFLIGPLVDRGIREWGISRLTWVSIAQLCCSIGLFTIGLGEGSNAATLFFIGLVVCFSLATMDLALDALAVKLVGDDQRMNLAAIKVGALAIGGVLGGGVLLGMYHRIHWIGIFIVAAMIPLASLVPLFNLEEPLPDIASSVRRISILGTFSRRQIYGRLVTIAVLTVSVVGVAYFQRLLLVQMHFSLETIGWALGTVSPITNGIVASLVPWMTRWFGTRPMLVISVIAFSVCNGLSMLYIQSNHNAAMLNICIASNAIGSVISVLIYRALLRWADGEQSATDYAVLCGGSRLVATGAIMLLPPIISQFGWGDFYGAATLVLLLSALAFASKEKMHN